MKKLITILCAMALIVGAISMVATAENYVIKIGDQGYTTLEAAVADADKGVLELQVDLDELVEIPENVVLNVDLNGKTVKSVSVPENSELYVMDSATDDFDGSDCGYIADVVSGEVFPMELDSAVRYLPVEDENGVSFHCLEMAIDTAILSPSKVGFSYNTTFKGDAAVKSQIAAFGVALSLEGEPVVEQDGTLSDHSKQTTFTDFVAGAAGNGGSSSKLVGVMAESNGYLANAANAQMDVYGKPYVKLTNGTYLLGAMAQYNFKDIAMAADEDAVWGIQSADAKKAMGEMYRTFKSVMKDWSLSNIVEQAAAIEQAIEDKTLKILTLGHSLALDSGHLLALIADAQGLPEGVDELVVGTLYYSGCELWRHVQYLTNNSPEYDLYISSTKTAQSIPVSTKKITMNYALTYDNWDLVIMQGGVFEIAKDATYTDGNIETIQQYVRENVKNPNVKFAWHMQWAPPTDDTLRATYPYTPNPYITTYEQYNDDRLTLYNAIAGSVERQVLPNETFEFIIPSGTAMQNAWSSSFTERQLHRDYVHASEFGRAISSYTWYCRLFGIDQLDEIKLDAIPKQFFHATRPVRTEPELTQLEKDVLLESVNNALKTPFAMTQSQYTSAS